MANLRETPTWEEGIYQWETSDPVMGGENGIDNKPTRQLANRTGWLKNEIARAIALIGTNQQTATQQFALKTTSLSAGAGLTGGGVLRDNMTLSLGTPSKITATSQNSAVSNTHTHEIDKASTSVAGIVKLNNTLTSDAQNEALTAAQGKALSEQIAAAIARSLNLKGSLTTQNLNDLHSAENYGVWQCALNANATTERNYPVNLAGVLLVLPSAYRGKQIYFSFHDQAIWMRDTRSNATDVTWSAWLKVGDERVAKSGDVMTGHLEIRAGSYSSVRLRNDGNRETRLETVPASNANYIFQFADRINDAGSFTTYGFPKEATNQTIAYRSWVENNFVNLHNNQTINGIKTFNNTPRFTSGIHIGSDNAFIGKGQDDYFFQNPLSGKYLQLKNDGTLQYENQKVALMGGALNDGVFATNNQIKVKYDHDWVGYVAEKITNKQGVGVYFDGAIAGAVRGGIQIRNEGGGRFDMLLHVTPSGAVNAADRRVVGLHIAHDAISSHAYGMFHTGFVRSGNGIGQNAGHQVKIGWDGRDRLKATIDNTDLGNIVFDQQLNTKSTVAVLTGKIAHGGTIPLPNGFAQHQCQWFVSMHNSNPANQTWDLREGGLGNHHTSNIWADGNRVVTCRVYRDVQAGAGGWQNAEANYIIIGVK